MVGCLAEGRVYRKEAVCTQLNRSAWASIAAGCTLGIGCFQFVSQEGRGTETGDDYVLDVECELL